MSRPSNGRIRPARNTSSVFAVAALIGSIAIIGAVVVGITEARPEVITCD